MEFFGRSKPILGRSKEYLEEPLYRWLFREGSSESTIRRRLNLFLKDAKKVYKWEVGDTIKKLRERKRFYPALKLSEVMERRGMGKTVSDQAIHLDLVAKVRGIPYAEDYFTKLPDSSKSLPTYGALLNCYCKERMTENAEGLMEKMKELGLEVTSMSYNSLMTLYTRTGRSDRVPSLVGEMRSANVAMDPYTYNVRMRAAAVTDGVAGAETVADEMRRDRRAFADWTAHSNLATVYANAGMADAAEAALKDLERVAGRTSLPALAFLVGMYGRTGNLIEAHRVWRLLRLAFPRTPNWCYARTVRVLVSLADLPGAEKCFAEWEAGLGQSPYDVRVANAMIQAYTDADMLDRAECVRKRAGIRGAKSNARTWEIYTNYYLRKDEVELALVCVEKGVRCGDWMPDQVEVTALFMRRFEEMKDVDGAERFVCALKKGNDSVDASVFRSLVRTYAAAGRTSIVMRRRLKMEKVELDNEMEQLLDSVSGPIDTE